MVKDAKLVGMLAILVLALALLAVFFVVYWLLASWLVDSVFKFDGWEGFLTKIVLFWIILGLGASIQKRTKKD